MVGHYHVMLCDVGWRNFSGRSHKAARDLRSPLIIWNPKPVSLGRVENSHDTHGLGLKLRNP